MKNSSKYLFYFKIKVLKKLLKKYFQNQLSKKNYIETDFVNHFSIETTIEKNPSTEQLRMEK